MPTYRLILESLTCERPANEGGDSVALGVYEGTAGNPSRWLFRTGEEVLDVNGRWDVDGVTPDFSGSVIVSLMDQDESGADISYGRLTVDANASGTTPTPAGSSLEARFTWRGTCYILRYRIVDAPPATASAGAAATSTDRNLEPDVSMLAAGSALPLERRLREIRASTANVATFRGHVLALARLCREALRRHEKRRLGEYLRDSNDSAADKVALAGRIVRDAARVEFFLGWMYHQGYSQTRNWEATPNRGAFPDVYLTELGNNMTDPDDRQWCTSMNGATYRWLGFHVVNSNSQAQEGRIFWSGYRLQAWARNGTNANGTALGNPLSTASGGVIETASARSSWRNSTGSLPSNTVTWNSLWTRLQGAGATPQPGDIVLIKNYGHTVMVDDVEASGNDFWIYTIEGNAGNAVRSRRINLRSTSDDGTYKDKSRRCLASNTASCTPPPQGTPAALIRRQYQRRFGIALVRPGFDNLAADPVTAQAAPVASDDAGNGAINVIHVGNVNEPGELVELLVDRLKTFMADASLPNGPWIQNPGGTRTYDWCGRPTGAMSIN